MVSTPDQDVKRRFRPRGNLVLVELLPKDKTTTAAGLVMPESMSSDFEYAIIRDIGSGVYAECGKRCPMDDIKIGDTVLLRGDTKDPRSGRTMQKSLIPVAPNSRLHLADEHAVYAVIEDAPLTTIREEDAE